MRCQVALEALRYERLITREAKEDAAPFRINVVSNVRSMNTAVCLSSVHRENSEQNDKRVQF